MPKKDTKNQKEDRRTRDAEKFKEGFDLAWDIAKKVYESGRPVTDPPIVELVKNNLA